jgi:NAD+ synthase
MPKPAAEGMSTSRAEADFLPAARGRIVSFIREFAAGSPNGVVLGISGGVDSALVAYLAVEALGNEKVLGILMPSSTTPKSDIEDALEVCRLLDIEHNTHSIDSVFSAFTTLLKAKKDKVTEGNLKARIRMCVLYWYANSMNKLVIGTDDKSEHTLGFYTKYGDGGVDFNPIGDLYKTEVREMSKMMGVPGSIVSKPSSPRLWEGHEAETELGISYAELDKQLVSGKVKDEKIRLMIKRNAHKAGDPPIPSLEDLRVGARS